MLPSRQFSASLSQLCPKLPVVAQQRKLSALPRETRDNNPPALWGLRAQRSQLLAKFANAVEHMCRLSVVVSGS